MWDEIWNGCGGEWDDNIYESVGMWGWMDVGMDGVWNGVGMDG